MVSTYDKVCTGEVTSIDTTVQTLVTVAFHYLKQTNGDAAEVRQTTLCTLKSQLSVWKSFLQGLLIKLFMISDIFISSLFYVFL